LEKVREAVGRCELFEDLDETQHAVLAERAELASYPEGKAIYAKGREADHTFGLIVSGEAEALSEGGIALRTLGPGQIIGEIGALSPQQKRTITLRAGKPTQVLEWRVDDVSGDVPELIKRLKDLAWRRVSDWFE
jgi:CRP-like cAMP-binding protein